MKAIHVLDDFIGDTTLFENDYGVAPSLETWAKAHKDVLNVEVENEVFQINVRALEFSHLDSEFLKYVNENWDNGKVYIVKE